MQRDLFNTLKAHLPSKDFTILTGARQTGKSTLLRQLESYCKKTGELSVFLNLENKNLLQTLNESPLNTLKLLPETTRRIVVFIDEIQYLDDPSNFLKLLHDEYSAAVKIVATGSSAFYLDEKFNDSLAGRKRIFRLLTCSFFEYLRLRGKEELLQEVVRIQTSPQAKTQQGELLQHEWLQYMLYGGYPAVITEPDVNEKIAYLTELRDSFVKRDVLEAGVQNETAFYTLFRLLASQSGQLVNINELATTVRIANETVIKYLYILQKCFHIALVKPFFKNLRKELTKMSKVYLMDTGLRNCLLHNFQSPEARMDKGELWENMYFRLLVEKYNPDDILFWRTTAGNEVDFILHPLTQPRAVEVKYDRETIRESKYRMFRTTYPDIPLDFAWMQPFDEDFFREILLA
ncbi:MAG: ATP-binding protein [Prevotellaceae bacterium]|jgi:predicted AAA+ superfamily ATPase|nr:ATP-binding protein [Prevotellaceae bacterium]